MDNRVNIHASAQPSHRQVLSGQYTSPVRYTQHVGHGVNLVPVQSANGEVLQKSVPMSGVPLSGSVTLTGAPQRVEYVNQPVQYLQQVVQTEQRPVLIQEQRPVVVQEQRRPVVVQEQRQVPVIIQQSPPRERVVIQEKIVEKPVYYEKEVEKIVEKQVEVPKIEYVEVEKKVEVPVYFENEDRINQLSIELNELQIKYQQELDNHQQTQIHAQTIQESHQNEVEEHNETRKRANKKPKEVVKEVYVDVVKEVPVEKVVTEYVDREVIRTVENVDEINRLKGDVDYWRRKAEEWEAKWVELSQEEVEYQVVQTRTRATQGGLKASSNINVQDSQKIENVLRNSMTSSQYQNQSNVVTVKDSGKFETVLRQSVSPSKVTETVKHAGRHHANTTQLRQTYSPSSQNLRSSGYTYNTTTQNDSFVGKSPARTVYYDN